MGEDFLTPWMSAVKNNSASKANNAAIMAQAIANANAQAATTKATDDALQLQRDQFEYQKSLQQPFFDTGKPAFDAYAKEVMTGVGKDGSFTPKESDSYKWQLEQANKNNSRILRALGRENSSYGMGEQFKSQQGLAATEYDKQLARLADLTNIARGGASSLASASSGFTNAAGQTILGEGNNLSSLYTNLGENVANSNLAGGMLKQNSMFNAQQNMGSLANLGLKAYDTFKNNNNNNFDWNESSGTIANYDPNTTYAGDSPGPWAGGE